MPPSLGVGASAWTARWGMGALDGRQAQRVVPPWTGVHAAFPRLSSGVTALPNSWKLQAKHGTPSGLRRLARHSVHQRLMHVISENQMH